MNTRNHFKKLLGWLVPRSQPTAPVPSAQELEEQRIHNLHEMTKFMKSQGVAKFSYDGNTVEFDVMRDSKTSQPVLLDDKQEQLRFLRETASELAKDEDINQYWSA